MPMTKMYRWEDKVKKITNLGVNGDDSSYCNGNDDTDVDDDDCYAIDADGDKNVDDGHLEEEGKVDIHVQHGLPSEMFTSSSTFTNFLTFQLPPFLAPLIDCIATGRITFGGSHLVSADDLKSF